MDMKTTINPDAEEQVFQIRQAGYIPVLDHAYDLAGEIYEQFRNQLFLAEEAKELLYILSQSHIRAVFDVHDRIANKEYLPVLPDVLPQCDDEDTAIKIVKLIKNSEPLGVTIKKRDTDGVIYVARVFVGGPAERSGLIQIGDEVHEVNGIPVKGRNIEQVVHILNTCDGTISLKLIPMPVHIDSPNSRVTMKAYFSYDPSTDSLIPCKDAGLGFKSGDILEVLNMDDPIWWQARLYYDHTNRTGLIPSRTLQARRASETYNNSIARALPSSPSVQRKLTSQSNMTSNITHATGSLLSPRLQKKLKKSKKVLHQAIIKEEFDAQLACSAPRLLYEEVQLYKAPPGKKRPIVLVGPAGVGKHDLKCKLLREHSDYVSPLPVTSRPKKLLETEGKEYNFISKHEMDKLIRNQRLLEYGEYKGNMYGVTLDCILNLINCGKVCLLTCQAQSLPTLKCAAIKPFIVFIKPPSLEKLKLMKIYSGEKSTKKLTPSEMEEMVLSAARIESLFGELCDEVIISTDFQQTYKHLTSLCQSVYTDEKWIPSCWLDT